MDFLRCANCCRWGQPWKLKTTMLCEDRHDEFGQPYTPSHRACKYFIPIQGSIPAPYTKMKMLVQSLTSDERAALRLAVEQADVLVEHQDSKGKELALGDLVIFKFDNVTYTGIVEGADPLLKMVNVFCPAFPDAAVSLDKRSVTKIDAEDARSCSVGDLTEFEAGTVEWHMECVLDEINRLRSLPKNEFTPDHYRELTEYTRRWNELDTRLRFGVVVRTIGK